MRPVECVPEDALGEILELPEHDPRRAHLRECPRCRALVASYEGFMTADDPAPYGDDEQRALDSARERLLGSPATSRGVSSPPSRAPSANRRAWWAAWLEPSRRPALAFAVMAIAVAGVLLVSRPWTPRPSDVVRGFGEAPLALASPAYEPNGGVKLAWRSSPLAASYEVQFFSVALDPIGRVSAESETTLVIPADRLPAAFAQGSPVLYRVAALRGKDEMAISGTGTIRKP